MKNAKIIEAKINEALKFLNEQDAKLKPILDYIQVQLIQKLQNPDWVDTTSVPQLFEMYQKTMEQYTNSILLLTKLQEIIKYEDGE